MNDSLWRQLDPLANRADSAVERFLNSPHAHELKAILKEVAEAMPTDCSVSLDITLNVFEPERGNPLPLLTTGLATSGPNEPYVTHGDSTPCRYVVDGEICELPHDRCPHCWAEWGFKIGHPLEPEGTYPCPNCGYEMGKIKMVAPDSRCQFV